MKLLTVIETLGQGGAERVLLNTLPELVKQGVKCEVAMLFHQDNLAGELQEMGVKVHKLNISNRWNVVEAVLKLNKLVKKGEYDVIHAHIFFAHFYTGLLKLVNRKFKSVVTFHNLGYNTYPAITLWKRFRKKLDRIVVNKLIDYRVGVSSAVQEHYRDHLKLKQIDRVFNGFPLWKIKEAAKEYSSLENFRNDYEFIVITPGRLVKEKGHKFLLGAIHKINSYLPENKILFAIVGDGPLYAELQQQVIKRELYNVKMLSAMNHDELMASVSGADLVLISSLSEGFPMIVGEAMVLGKPIIATNVGGIPDFIDEGINGTMVVAGNSDKLTSAFLDLYKNKDLQDVFSENAKLKASQFDIKEIAKQWVGIYNKLLNEN